MTTIKKDKKKDERPRSNTVVEDGEGLMAPLVVAVGPMKAEKADPTEKAEKTVRTGYLKVTARQYVQARGIRWERAAGFLHWAANKYGAGHLLTVQEWTAVHEEFNLTPVGR